MSLGTDTSRSPDVVVVGGGPAGAAAARSLALLGHDVRLLTCQTRASRDLAESIPPSCGKLFQALGVKSAVEGAGFLPSPGNAVAWGDRPLATVPFPDGTGWQVRRGQLSRVLLQLAGAAGAHVVEDATVVEVGPPGAPSEDGGVQVIFHRAGDRLGSAGGYRSLQTPFVLDCSGRAGVLASRFRVKEDRPTTIALVGIWSDLPDSGLHSEGHTLVESYENGWLWAIPVDREDRYVTLMVDPELTPLERGEGPEAVYLSELSKTRHAAQMTSRGRFRGEVSVWGATPYQVSRFSGPGYLLVGDAAAFIDPLSSFGVKRALASGWLASIVAHTVISDPTREVIARQLFEERERETVESFQDQAAEFYRLGADAHDHEFWSKRAVRPDIQQEESEARSGESRGPFDDRALEDAFSSGAPEVSRLREDRRVREAFEKLRSAEQIDLRPRRVLEWTQAPGIEGNEVVLEPRLATPSFPKGLRFLRDVDVVRMMGLLEGLRASDPSRTWGVPDLHEAYGRGGNPVPLADFIGALSVLLAEEVLTNAASERGTSPIESTSG